MKKIFISKKCIKHSNIGTFIYDSGTLKLKSGGHGQDNIKFLQSKGIESNIKIEYNNGVRLGTVKSHINNIDGHMYQQAWFPKKWTAKKIKEAGRYVLSLKKNANKPSGITLLGTKNKVKVGVKKRFGYAQTIFPIYRQKGGIKNDYR